jgi:serine protease Do
MKQYWLKISAFAFAVALLLPVSLLAQKEKEEKETKEAKEKKEVEQIIITKKGDSNDKVVVEIIGDKITVNGKPLDEYKDKDGNVSVRRGRYKSDYGDLLSMTRTPGGRGWGVGDADAFTYFNSDSNHAMLGVTTEKTDEGVKINDITKETAAEKMGLKEGDIITKVGDVKIEDPDDLSKVIRDHKPGDKVTITYLRDKKEQKATAELTKWKGANAWAFGPNESFKMNLDDMKGFMPKIQTAPELRRLYNQNWNWSGGSPKLGLSVQDTDDGKGVKVIDVDDESNAAKAGIKNDDVITEVDGKAVNGTDEMVKIIKESKDKTSINLKLQRGGKTQNIEVKMPRKIKSADL